MYRLDFMVYPTVQVLPPTRDELETRNPGLAFPTNTVIGSRPAASLDHFRSASPDTACPWGWNLPGTPLAEAEDAGVCLRRDLRAAPPGASAEAEYLD